MPLKFFNSEIRCHWNRTLSANYHSKNNNRKIQLTFSRHMHAGKYSNLTSIFFNRIYQFYISLSFIHVITSEKLSRKNSITYTKSEMWVFIYARGCLQTSVAREQFPIHPILYSYQKTTTYLGKFNMEFIIWYPRLINIDSVI